MVKIQMSELDSQLEFYINGVAILVIASLGILGNILSLLLFTFRYFPFKYVNHPNLSQRSTMKAAQAEPMQLSTTERKSSMNLMHRMDFDHCDHHNHSGHLHSCDVFHILTPRICFSYCCCVTKKSPSNGHQSWVTRPERPKGAKDEAKDAQRVSSKKSRL